MARLLSTLALVAAFVLPSLAHAAPPAGATSYPANKVWLSGKDKSLETAITDGSLTKPNEYTVATMPDCSQTTNSGRMFVVTNALSAGICTVATSPGSRVECACVAGVAQPVGVLLGVALGTGNTDVFDVANATVAGIVASTIGLDSQSPNMIFAGPSTGSSADPTFRAMVSADIPADGVTSAKIADGTIVVGDLADGAVTSAKILDATITTDDIGVGAVDSPDIATGAVTNAKLAADSVTSAKIADANVASIDIADGTITTTDISASAGITDGQVSNTLTASILAGSGSTTDAVDLATAEVAGILPAANIDAAISRVADIAVASSGTGSPETVVTCTAKPCYYTQTDMSPPVLWQFMRGTNGTAIGWDRINEPNTTPWPIDVSLQDCSGGVCPNPYGAFVIDTSVFWASVPGGRYDSDGSMWTSGTANDATDWINDSTEYTVSGASTQWTRVLTAPSNSGNFDTLLCRLNGAGAPASFAACKVDDGSSNLCQTKYGSATFEALMLYENTSDDYWPLSTTAYNGCNSASVSVSTANGLPVTTDASDKVQLAVPDGTHGYKYYHRWLAQLVLNAAEEFVFVPLVNAITNGYAETSCATTAWAENGGGALSLKAFDPTAPGVATNAVRGNGCVFITAAATDSADTAAFNVVPGRIYVVRGYARINATATDTLKFEIIDQGGTALNTTEVQAWHILGGSNIGSAIEWTNETASNTECYQWCHVIIKFRAGPSQSTAKLRTINGNAGGTAVMTFNLDEWAAFPSPTQNLQLNPFIKDGLVRLRVLGDSRSNSTTDNNDFGVALDDMLASTRPYLSLVSPVVTRLDATGGRDTQDVVDESYATIRGQISDYTLIYFGVNDANGDTTSATFAGTGFTAATAGNMLKIVREVRKSGSIPVVITDWPYKGDTSLTDCNDGSAANCAVVMTEYWRKIIQNAYLY